MITINEGNTITVTDDGRGIPVDIQAQTGKPALEVVYTVLHAGGKFGGGGYKVSGGLHGVGASVVNALSEWLEVEVSKDGKIYQMKFSRGQVLKKVVGVFVLTLAIRNVYAFSYVLLRLKGYTNPGQAAPAWARNWATKSYR